MTARWIGVLLAATLVATVAVRSAGLVEMTSRRTLTVEMSRWQDRELADDVERAIGHWLAQVPQPDLHIRYIDRPELIGRARLSMDGRTAELGQGPFAAQLRPPLETLIARIGRPQRVFLVTTDRPVDRRFATRVRGLLAELSIERIVEVPAARRLEDGSPTIASGPRDWVLVATEAGREHMRTLLRARGRKIMVLPPYAAALQRPHPDLWFIAPWNPELEYFPGRATSSCLAATRLDLGGGFWPVTGVQLWALAALSEVVSGEPAQEAPLSLVGMPPTGAEPAHEYRAGGPLPTCAAR